MGSEQEKGAIEHVTKAAEAEHEDRKILEEAKARQPPSSASSRTSSSSSLTSLESDSDRNSELNDSIESGRDSEILEEIKNRQLPSAPPLKLSLSSRASLELNIDRNIHLSDPIAKSKSEGDLSLEQESICPRDSPAQTPQWSISCSSPSIDFTSPPVQTMENPSCYDPGRIPASAFSSKAANEWSTTSIDSLFSIRMGNSSLARDQFRSGELPKLDSLCVSDAKPNELSSLPPLMEVTPNEECGVKSSDVSTLENDDPFDSPKVTQGASNRASMSRISTESGQSNRSFAFPVLVCEGGKSCRSSLERVEERPELQTQDSEFAADQKSMMRRWCSWSCCLPRCCLPRCC